MPLDQVPVAMEQQYSPERERLVFMAGGEYFATHRWEVNEKGFASAALFDKSDGSVSTFRSLIPDRWSLLSLAEDHFLIRREDIQFDDSSDLIEGDDAEDEGE